LKLTSSDNGNEIEMDMDFPDPKPAGPNNSILPMNNLPALYRWIEKKQGDTTKKKKKKNGTPPKVEPTVDILLEEKQAGTFWDDEDDMGLECLLKPPSAKKAEGDDEGSDSGGQYQECFSLGDCIDDDPAGDLEENLTNSTYSSASISSASSQEDDLAPLKQELQVQCLKKKKWQPPPIMSDCPLNNNDVNHNIDHNDVVVDDIFVNEEEESDEEDDDRQNLESEMGMIVHKMEKLMTRMDELCHSYSSRGGRKQLDFPNAMEYAAFLEEQEKSLLVENDTTDITAKTTANIREEKKLLRHGQPPPKINPKTALPRITPLKTGLRRLGKAMDRTHPWDQAPLDPTIQESYEPYAEESVDHDIENGKVTEQWENELESVDMEQRSSLGGDTVDVGDEKVPTKTRRSSSRTMESKVWDERMVGHFPSPDIDAEPPMTNPLVSGGNDLAEFRRSLEYSDFKKLAVVPCKEEGTADELPPKKSNVSPPGWFPTKKQAGRMARSTALLFVFLVLLAGLGVSVLGAMGTPNDSHNDSHNDSNTEDDDTKGFLAYFRDDVVPWYTKVSLQFPGSPQEKAFRWLHDDLDHNGILSNETSLQRFALATLFHATGGENSWKESTKWLDHTGSECKWFSRDFQSELICDGTEQYHTLSLRGNGLKGQLPDELELLTSLNIVQLQDNQITGGLPNHFLSLKHLAYLNLDNNTLTGLLPSEIEELSNASLLNTLRLSNNQFSGTLPRELGSVLNLDFLSLSHNQFQGSIPSSLGLLTSLTALELHRNHLTGSVPQEVCDLMVWGNLKRLTVDCARVHCPTDCNCDCTSTTEKT